MKKYLVLLLVASLAISLFSACIGDNNLSSSDETSEAVSKEPKTVDMTAVLAKFKTEFKAQEIREVSEDDIYRDTGINPDSYQGHFWLTEISGLSSEKACMFAAKDENAAAGILTKLQTLLDSELAQQKEYNADNYAMLQKAVIGKNGVYVYLLISPNIDKLEATLNAAF